MIEFNVNHHVRVKLTDIGRADKREMEKLDIISKA